MRLLHMISPHFNVLAVLAKKGETLVTNNGELNIVTNQLKYVKKKCLLARIKAIHYKLEKYSKDVVIYARDSTEEQDIITQLRDCFDFCKRKQFRITTIYADCGVSGKRLNKPAQRQLRQDVLAGKFSTLVVWELSRITRLGPKNMLDFFYVMDEADVSILSVNEPMINTESTLVRDIVISLLGALSKEESERLSRRVKAGLKKVKAEGKKLGAQTKSIDIDELMNLYTTNPEWGWRKIVEKYNSKRRGKNRISWATARNRILEKIGGGKRENE